MFPETLFRIGGMSITIYEIMYGVGLVGVCLICLYTKKRFNISFLHYCIYIGISLVLGLVGARYMGEIHIEVIKLVTDGQVVPTSSMRTSGALILIPLGMLIVSPLLKHSFRVIMDFMAPGIFCFFTCAKLGCFLCGCCYGWHDDNGLYNKVAGDYVFPVQIYEAAFILLVTVMLVVLYVLENKGKVKLRCGALYPIGTIVYCITRFGWEKQRYYKYDIDYNFIFNISYWQLMLIIAAVLAIVWLIILYRVKMFSVIPEPRQYTIWQIREFTDNISGKIENCQRNRHKKKAQKHKAKADMLKKQQKKN